MRAGPTLSQWMNIAQLIWICQLIFLSFVTPTINADSWSSDEVVSDIPTISQYWGNLKPYGEVSENNFNVKNTGLPHGCQVEQVQLLHRHGSRYPPSSEYSLMTSFAAKVAAVINAGDQFIGPLSFLKAWRLDLGVDSLVASGAAMAYTSGTDFWKKYGRILYNAAPNQTTYDPTGQEKPLIRSNTLPRVYDTMRAWSEGFFGPYNATDKYRILTIPFAPHVNNTLASFLSCANFLVPTSAINQIGGTLTDYVPFYLTDAVARIAKYVPQSMNLSTLDCFNMQQLCAYEYSALGSSDFCKLFTLREWQAYEYLLDAYYYRFSSFGNPVGRSVGIGILSEILARLQKEYITTSSTSVNSTLDSNPDTFPLNQKFYADFDHDLAIWGILAAMSLDYFRQPLPLVYPPPDRHFRVSEVTPYTARLVVEKIGCSEASPEVRRETETQYAPYQNGYNPDNAPYKFVRLRLNNGILPLNTIRGGQCDLPRRTDGLCPLQNFIDSQANAEYLANYQFVCFGNYTIDSNSFDGDGTFFP